MTTNPQDHDPSQAPRAAEVNSSSKEPRIRWEDGNGYRLIRIATNGHSEPLPGTRKVYSYDDLSMSQVVLVLSEHSGGSRDFLDWWKESNGARDWVIAHGSRWSPEFFEWSAEVSKCTRETFGQGLNALGRTELGSAERAENLVRTAPGSAKKNDSEKKNDPEKRITVVIRDLTELGKKSGLRAARALRSVSERRPAVLEQIIILSHNEDPFINAVEASPLSNIAVEFRLSGLEPREIGRLAAERRLNFTERARQAAFRLTGGQPHLVQAFLSILRPEPSDGASVSERTVNHAARRLLESPSDATNLWQRDLGRILESNPQLISRVKGFAMGKTIGPTSFPPPHEDRPLFIAGWLGIDLEGRWGIRSRVHARLARQVLDKLGGRA